MIIIIIIVVINRCTALKVLMVAVITKTVSFHLSSNKVLDAHVHGWMDRQKSEKPNASSHYLGCRLVKMWLSATLLLTKVFLSLDYS